MPRAKAQLSLQPAAIADLSLCPTIAFLMLLIISTTFFSALYASAAASTAINEAQALILFKHGISRDPFGLLDSWSSDSNHTSDQVHPCGRRRSAWAGVSCDAQQLRVVSLNLCSFHLSGSISSSLALLPWLSWLDLSDNHLSGQLPASLFDGAQFASMLQYLNLSSNLLGGSLPQAIGNLSALTQLDLSHNVFTGLLPARIWHLPKLQLLWLKSPGGANPLNASLSVGWFGFCPTIKDLRVSGLALAAGQIPPSLGQCKQLHHLVLQDNGLQGTIPQGVWQLPSLKVLYLVETVYAAGLRMEAVPELLSFCSTITQLWLQGFTLAPAPSTPTGHISPSLGDCKQLEFLILDIGGNLPSGFVTPGIWQLPRLRVLTWVDVQVKIIIDTSSSGLTRPFMLSATMPETFGFCSTITHLQIDGINLTGEIPASLGSCKGLTYLELSHGSLQGAIPTALQNLTHLQGLSFESNFITGGIPTWMSNLSELTGLDLGDNPLSGRVPAELGQLEQLQMLSLFTANLSGPVPEELGNCTQLEWLDLGSNSVVYVNQLQGFPKSFAGLKNLKTLAWHGDPTVPSKGFMQVLVNFTLIEYINVSTSGFYGAIPPQLGSRLSTLDLSVNEIIGSIPAQLGNLSVLAHLNLGNNHLEGPLAPQLASLSSHLQFCNLATNNFSGSIPLWLGQFPNLQYLNLGTNKFTGSIPYQFITNLSASPIKNLYLDTNQLEGPIPPLLGNCSSLQDLSLANNNLEGRIPPTLGQLLAISQHLLLSNNSLTGEIPEELGHLVLLKVLDLSRNRLVGQIPRALENCTRLETLRLFNNGLMGAVAKLDISRMENLKTVTIQHNLLVGGLPAFINSTSLILVDFGNNNFDGEFPTASRGQRQGDIVAGALSSLRVLSMASNRVSGVIPDWVWELPSLQLLDLSDNLLTGHMPRTLAHLKYLKLQISSQINGSLTLYEEVPVTLKDSPQVLSYVLNSRILIDLSMNALEGSISESFGTLIGLQSLNLSHNHITGNIPPSLSNLSQLESLDVSYNSLTGGIPEDLGSLSKLSTFSASDNQLQGRIPTLNNFNTRFDLSSFNNNPNLCGFPISKHCLVPVVQGNKNLGPIPIKTRRKNPFKNWLSDNIELGGFFVGYPLGIILGLCVACLVSKSFISYYKAFCRKVVKKVTFGLPSKTLVSRLRKFRV